MPNLLIADDHPLVRDGIVAILERAALGVLQLDGGKEQAVGRGFRLLRQQGLFQPQAGARLFEKCRRGADGFRDRLDAADAADAGRVAGDAAPAGDGSAAGATEGCAAVVPGAEAAAGASGARSLHAASSSAAAATTATSPGR